MEVCGTTCSTIRIATVQQVVSIYCDCCGKEKLAEIRGSKLVIFDTRHGERHFVTLEIEKIQALTSVI